MPRYQVVILESSELTYDIEADSPEAAIAIWQNSDDSSERGEPQEELLGHEVLCVIDPDGKTIEAGDLPDPLDLAPALEAPTPATS